MKKKTNYNRIAKSYSSDSLGEVPERKHMFYSTWLEECGNVEGMVTLDLGCGSGRSSRLLALKGAIVTGVDSSLAMLEIAKTTEKERSLGITYHLRDIHEPLNIDKQYDLVTAVMVLHYARTINQLESAVKNISTHLKPGGKMVLLNSNVEKPTRRLEERDVNNPTQWIGEPYKDGSEIEVTLYGVDREKVATFSIYFWSKETLEFVFKKNGLKNIKWVSLRVDEEGKNLIPDWKNVEKESTLMVISAMK